MHVSEMHAQSSPDVCFLSVCVSVNIYRARPEEDFTLMARKRLSCPVCVCPYSVTLMGIWDVLPLWQRLKSVQGLNMKTGGPSDRSAWSSFEYESLSMKPEKCMKVKKISCDLLNIFNTQIFFQLKKLIVPLLNRHQVY